MSYIEIYKYIEEIIDKKHFGGKYIPSIFPYEICKYIKSCKDKDLIQLLSEVLCKAVLNELAYPCKDNSDNLNDHAQVLKFIVDNIQIDKQKLINIKTLIIEKYKIHLEQFFSDHKNLAEFKFDKLNKDIDFYCNL